MDNTQLRKWAVDAAPQAAESVRLRVERNYYQVAAADAQEQLKIAHGEIAARQRTIPVKDAISQLTGLEPRSAEKPETVLFLMPNGQKISVNEVTNRFENLTPDIPFFTKPVRIRGRGAIDAVQFLTGWSFEETTEWLSDTYSAPDAVNAAAQKAQVHLEIAEDTPQRFERRLNAEKVNRELETPEPEGWAKLFAILSSRFLISMDFLKKLHAEKRIFANKFGHMVAQKTQFNGSASIPAGNIVIDPNDPEIPIKETGDGGIIALLRPDAERAVISTSVLEALCMHGQSDHQNDSIIVLGSKVDDTTIADIGKVSRLYSGPIYWAETFSKIGRKIISRVKEHFPDITEIKLPDEINSWIGFHIESWKKQRPVKEKTAPTTKIVEKDEGQSMN